MTLGLQKVAEILGLQQDTLTQYFDKIDAEDISALSDLYIHSDSEYSKTLSPFTQKLSLEKQKELLQQVVKKRLPDGKAYKNSAAELTRKIFSNIFADNFKLSPVKLNPHAKQDEAVKVPDEVPHEVVCYAPPATQEQLAKANQKLNALEEETANKAQKGTAVPGFEASLGYTIYKPLNPTPLIYLTFYGGYKVSDLAGLAKNILSSSPPHLLNRYLLQHNITVIALHTPDIYENKKFQAKMEEPMFDKVLSSVDAFLKSDIYKNTCEEIKKKNPENPKAPELYMFGGSFGGGMVTRFAQEYGEKYPDLKGVISWNGALTNREPDLEYLDATQNIKKLEVPIKVLISSHDNQVMPQQFLAFYEALKREKKTHLLDFTIIRRGNVALPEAWRYATNYLGHFVSSSAFPYIKGFMEKDKSDRFLKEEIYGNSPGPPAKKE